MNKKTDLLVIGAGPGGYVAAIRGAQLGLKVAIVEKEYFGGVCLNVGCIPSKALITVGRQFHQANHNWDTFGLKAQKITFDFKKVQAFKNATVTKLTSGIETLLKGNKIDIYKGNAVFKNANTVVISGSETTELNFDNVIIATGSHPIEIPSLKFSERIINSTGALSLNDVPESLIVVGGGVIGIELATMYANFGSKVTILEGAADILTPTSQQVTAVVKKELKNKGVELYTNAFVKSGETKGDKSVIVAEIKGEVKTFEASYTLVSVGRRPNTANIGLENTGILLTDSKHIKVDLQNRTSVPHIFAIGDVTPGVQLAHRASYEAKVAAEVIAGHKVINDYKAIPGAIFSDPEIATVGKSEKDLKNTSIEFIAKKFPFAVSGRAISMNETNGFVNIIADKKTEKVLGAEIVGPDASDLINELTLAIEAGLTVEDIALTIHPHPTLGEVVMEAAEAVLGKPTHII